MPSAISFDGTASPPILGGEYALLNFGHRNSYQRLPPPCARWDDLSMTESPEQLHINFQLAFNSHDLDSIVALYEPTAVLASAGGTVQGTDAIRDAYRGFLAIHP